MGEDHEVVFVVAEDVRAARRAAKAKWGGDGRPHVDALTRLDSPPLSTSELRAPGGAYVVGYEGTEAVAGGGVRRLADGVAEIKRMYVRPDARSRGVARALLAALEASASALGYETVRLDTGPKQVHALALYRSAGYVDVAPYNDNPFACFWGEKRLDPTHLS